MEKKRVATCVTCDDKENTIETNQTIAFVQDE